ncbi:MAG: ATP-binding protein [Promethearchaeota archaeon]
MSEDKYRKVARIIVKAGLIPFPINDTMIDLLKLLINEEQLPFIMAFRKSFSQTMEQLKVSSKMSEDDIKMHVKKLAIKGLLFNQPNTKGVMVYRLMPIMMIGAFEYTFMKKIEISEETEKLAMLFAKLFNELTDFVQKNYDTIVPIYQNFPPIDRTVPILDKTTSSEEVKILINEEISLPEEKVLPTQKIEELINKFDVIAVGHCFCRNHKDLLGNPCKQTELRENCFTFGKSARYTVEQGFARLIDKNEALKILKLSEEAGLVHKAFHPHEDITRAETSICNCCECCCATFERWREGTISMINSTNYLSHIDEDLCTGCSICTDKCPVNAIAVNDNNVAERNADWCIGCGICAHFCPENAISLLEGMRKVYVLPPKIRN